MNSAVQAFKALLLRKMPLPIQALLASSTTRNLVAIALAYTLLKPFNRFMSGRVLNNWTPDTYDWSREIVLLTGGCNGIGKSVAYALASKGIKVCIADVLEPTEPLPPNVHFYKCDVTSTASIKAMAAQIRQEHGDPTVLINNAGVAQGGPILAKPEALVRKVFEVNTMAHWWMVQEFLPAMLKRNHGHVVTMASASSFMGMGALIDYSSTKASALAFHEGLTQEIRFWYKAEKVRTSIIHPIWVKTDLIKPILDSGVKMRHPVLEIEDVTNIIVKHILSGNSGQVIIPERLGGGAGLIRALPNWVQEYVRNGVSNDLMKIRLAQEAREREAAKS